MTVGCVSPVIYRWSTQWLHHPPGNGNAPTFESVTPISRRIIGVACAAALQHCVRDAGCRH